MFFTKSTSVGKETRKIPLMNDISIEEWSNTWDAIEAQEYIPTIPEMGRVLSASFGTQLFEGTCVAEQSISWTRGMSDSFLQGSVP